MTDISNHEQGRKMRNAMKRKLEPCRELVVFLHSVFLWERPWHPTLIVGAVSSLFLFYWYWSPSAITTVALILMADLILDYCIPLISNAVKPPQAWTAIKESKFEMACDSIVNTKQSVLGFKTYLQLLKETQPTKYFSILIPSLGIIAWIGSIFSSFTLCYFFAVLAALYPGIRHRRLIERWAAVCFDKMSDTLRNMKKTN